MIRDLCSLWQPCRRRCCLRWPHLAHASRMHYGRLHQQIEEVGCGETLRACSKTVFVPDAQACLQRRSRSCVANATFRHVSRLPIGPILHSESEGIERCVEIAAPTSILSWPGSSQVVNWAGPGAIEVSSAFGFLLASILFHMYSAFRVGIASATHDVSRKVRCSSSPVMV